MSTFDVLSPRYLSSSSGTSISPSLSPVTLMIARKAFSLQRISAAAGCPTRTEGEPNSLPEVIRLSEKGDEDEAYNCSDLLVEYR